MRDFILTFDDGPSQWTRAILDILFDHDVKAVFFVTGQHAKDNLEIIAQASDEGNVIGNHGFTHRRLTDLSQPEIRQELAVTSELIEQATGIPPTLFRAPYFGVDERVLAIAAELGLEHVGASMIPDDWMEADGQIIAERVLPQLHPDSVVCLHDGIPPDGGSHWCTDSRQPTVDAVRMILEARP